jgi:hypothetical protein
MAEFWLPETRELIQVAQNLAQPATREREVRASTDAPRDLGLTRFVRWPSGDALGAEAGDATQ